MNNFSVASADQRWNYSTLQRFAEFLQHKKWEPAAHARNYDLVLIQILAHARVALTFCVARTLQNAVHPRAVKELKKLKKIKIF